MLFPILGEGRIWLGERIPCIIGNFYSLVTFGLIVYSLLLIDLFLNYSAKSSEAISDNYGYFLL